MKTKILAALAACAALVLALSGCGVTKLSDSSTQLDVIGDVQITSSFCTSPGSTSTTPLKLNTVRAAGLPSPCTTTSSEQRGQALVGYRIPVDSTAPATPPSTNSGSSDLNFHRSDSYGAYLESQYHEDGMQWVGYISDPQTVPAGNTFRYTVSPQFTLPTPGKPYVGPYPYNVVGGYRVLTSAQDGSSDVSCTDSQTSCVSTNTPNSTNDEHQDTRDLGVLPNGSPNTVVAGTGGTVSVPFTLRYAGTADDQADFDLAGSTSVPGATLSLSQSTYKPGDNQEAPATVNVQVPANTPAGQYTVSLKATVSGRGQPILFKRKAKKARKRRRGVHSSQSASQPQSRTGDVTITVVAAQQPAQAQAEPARAALRLKLTAAPSKAYAGSTAAYRVVATNSSRNVANGVSVCSRLPGNVQFRKASRKVRFSGQSVCFDATTLSANGSTAARILVRIDRDAHTGQARASASATASNADRATARAALRVLRRAQAVRPAPVTG